MKALQFALQVIEYDRLVATGKTKDGERVQINGIMAIKIREDLLKKVGEALVVELAAALKLEERKQSE